MKITGYTQKKELFEFLRENKRLVAAEKMKATKESDGVSAIFYNPSLEKIEAKKNISKPDIIENDKYKIIPVINTTNIVDSHMDLHVPGLWKKNLKEQKNRFFLQEHVNKFDHVISDEVTAYTQVFKWADLGAKYEGETEALLFEVIAEVKRNEFMATQYANGWVKNHSVGMQYVKIFLAMNSENKYDVEEKEIWDKYYNIIANKEYVDDMGYFWAVTEAKAVEGSSVVAGSNSITPTYSIESIKNEPVVSTHENTEPSIDTQKSNREFFINFLNQ